MVSHLLHKVREKNGAPGSNRHRSATISEMNWKIFQIVAFVALSVLTFPMPALSDDTAVAIAAGGLVPRRETRIIMAKEVLRISDKKVVVDYEFRNDTDKDVATELAFPVPPYQNDFPEGDAHAQSFKSFRLWIDGKLTHYQSEVRATLKSKDVTDLLEADHIDIPTFGHFDDTSGDAHHAAQILVPDFTRLPKAEQNRLFKEGLFEDGGEMAFSRYTVHLQYHWKQTFPAHSTVHIRHEYAPVEGWVDSMPVDALQLALTPGSAQKYAERWSDSGAEDIAGFCPEPEVLQGMIRRISEDKVSSDNYKSFPLHWVDFILTSANSWQRPIEDFTLIIERPQQEQSQKTLISFCAPKDGKVEKLDADHFQVHLANFIPTAELHIGFFDVPMAKPARPPAKR